MGNFRRLVKPVILLFFIGFLCIASFNYYTSESNALVDWGEALKSSVEQPKKEILTNNDETSYSDDSNERERKEKYVEEVEKLPAILRNMENYLGEPASQKVSPTKSKKIKKVKSPKKKKKPRPTPSPTTTSTTSTTQTEIFPDDENFENNHDQSEPEIFSENEIINHQSNELENFLNNKIFQNNLDQSGQPEFFSDNENVQNIDHESEQPEILSDNKNFENYHHQNEEPEIFSDNGIYQNIPNQNERPENNKKVHHQKVDVTPKGWTYKGPDTMRCSVRTIGCFLPAPDSSVKKVKVLIDSSEKMTDWLCIKLCSKSAKDKRDVYAGLRNGYECRCVFKVTDLIVLELSDQCNQPCLGDTSLQCGGLNDITMLYLVKSECVPVSASDLPSITSESSPLGCFWKPTDFHLYMEEYRLAKDHLPQRCILHCERKGLILATPSYPDLCYCGLTVQEFDLQNPVDDVMCRKHKMEFVRVYKTKIEDRRCGDKRFLKEGEWTKRIGLGSFPGSGNTWLRHLIESATGVYTGSVYTDVALVQGGYLGEKLHMDSRKVAVVKFHDPIYITNKTMTNALIHVFRNPYNAVLSEFTRRSTHGHTKTVDSENFNRASFRKVTEGQFIQRWTKETRRAVEVEVPKIIFSYEDLVQNPIYYSEKMARFIMGDLLSEKELQDRLLCLRLSTQGDFKRKKKPLNFDPYTNKAKESFNANIKLVENWLDQYGYDHHIDYYREPTNNR